MDECQQHQPGLMCVRVTDTCIVNCKQSCFKCFQLVKAMSLVRSCGVGALLYVTIISQLCVNAAGPCMLMSAVQEQVVKALEAQNAKAEEAAVAISAAATVRSEAEARVQSLQRQLDATVFQIRELAEQGQTPLTEESESLLETPNNIGYGITLRSMASCHVEFSCTPAAALVLGRNHYSCVPIIMQLICEFCNTQFLELFSARFSGYRPTGT